MPKLPHLSGREVIGALERLGFAAVRQTGSQEQFLHALLGVKHHSISQAWAVSG
jgi:predicted RNA binding protein YcfA (HicA-like mRNA interferase family)